MSDPPRKRGRPVADEPKSTVSVWLPTVDHDRLIKLARKQDRSVSGLVREVLTREMRNPPRRDEPSE